MAKATRLASGSYRVRVFAGTDINGKKKYISITRPTKKEAEFAALEMQMNRQKMERPNQLTFTSAIDAYINLKQNILSPTTIRGYRGIQKNQLQPLMNIKLSKLTQEMIQKVINDESATLSPKTIRNGHGLLSAVLDEYFPTFVLKTKLPSKVKFVPTIPNQVEVARLLKIVKNTEIELPVLLGLWLGLRMSEIKGLMFEDLQDNLLHIRRAMVLVNGEYILKSTKTYTSTRTLPIPDYIVNLINTIEIKENI